LLTSNTGSILRATLPAKQLLLLTGCASSERIALVASPAQQSLTRDGVPALLSAQKQVVMLRPVAASVRRGDRPTFVLAVYNRAKRPAELRVANITAHHVGDGKQKPVRVFTHEELVAEARRKQTWAAVGAALSGAGGALSAANAGYSHTQGTYTGYARGPYSNVSVGGTYTATTYDPSKAYAAQAINNAQTAANFAAIEAEGQQQLSALQNTILKDNTVLPGEWIGGLVVLDEPSKGADGIARYQVNVRFGDELHSFNINQAHSS
jgi:hypothetical protein